VGIFGSICSKGRDSRAQGANKEGRLLTTFYRELCLVLTGSFCRHLLVSCGVEGYGDKEENTEHWQKV